MDKIDIYNDSAIILERKTPKSIISWLTILIMLLTLFIIFSFVPFNIYKSYNGYINIDNNVSYITLSLDLSDFPINKDNIMYIKNEKYNYEIIDIIENSIILKVDIKYDIKIENNYVLVNILKEKTNLFKIIKNKIKKGFGI